VFTEEELQAHFEKYKDRVAGQGLDFGYFVDPQVQIQYIEIDPAEIKKGLRGAESSYVKRALRYWKDNPEDRRFRKPPSVLKAEEEALAEASTNGQPEQTVSPFYDDFEDVREAAVNAVKAQDAKAEAGRIAGELSRVLAEPWLDLTAGRSEYKTAPDSVKGLQYYDQVVAELPPNMQYEAGVKVGFIDWVTESELASTRGGLGSTFLPIDNATTMRFNQLAFLVEGLAEIPERISDRSLYLSMWETSSKTMGGVDDVLYLFRVVGARPGHVPEGLDEVREEVIRDLRLVRGMERAREAAERLAVRAREIGLKEAWEEDTELVERVTPDLGNYYKPVPFGRQDKSGLLPLVSYVGRANQEFVDKSFELAAAGEDSDVAVIELPEVAKVAAIKGRKLQPLYDETYLAERANLQQELRLAAIREVVRPWLNPKQIRERNDFKLTGFDD
jgi:hypothetical protein